MNAIQTLSNQSQEKIRRKKYRGRIVSHLFVPWGSTLFHNGWVFFKCKTLFLDCSTIVPGDSLWSKTNSKRHSKVEHRSRCIIHNIQAKCQLKFATNCYKSQFILMIVILRFQTVSISFFFLFFFKWKFRLQHMIILKIIHLPWNSII